jgi:hypothetical protein
MLYGNIIHFIFQQVITELRAISRNDPRIHMNVLRYTSRAKRGSAKHGFIDEFAFPWRQAIFGYPLNKSFLTDLHEILHD